MGSSETAETEFRKVLRQERESRKWSQAHLAKLLSDKGFAIYPTTIAKIESGERAARIDELVAVADLFGISVDALLGHSPKGRKGRQSIAFGGLHLALQKTIGDVGSLDAALRGQLLELDGLALRKDEQAARDECRNAADALVEAIAALYKASRRVSPINQRYVSEFLFDDEEN